MPPLLDLFHDQHGLLFGIKIYGHPLHIQLVVVIIAVRSIPTTLLHLSCHKIKIIYLKRHHPMKELNVLTTTTTNPYILILTTNPNVKCAFLKKFGGEVLGVLASVPFHAAPNIFKNPSTIRSTSTTCANDLQNMKKTTDINTAVTAMILCIKTLSQTRKN